MELKIPKLYDWQVLESVAPYLNIGDLIKTLTISKEYDYTLRKYLRKHILPKSSSSQGNQNQLTTLKKTFHRQLKLIDSSNNTINKVSFIPTLLLQSIQVGSSHCLLQSIQGKHCLIPNPQLLHTQDKLKTYTQVQPAYLSPHLTLIDSHLYTTHGNQLQRISIRQEQDKTVLHKDGQMQFEAEIAHLKVSQTHVYVVTGNALDGQRLRAVNLKQFTGRDVLVQQEGKHVERIQPQDLTVGVNVALYVRDAKVYQLDLQGMKQPKLLKALQDRRIRKILCGAKHFFAIEKSNKLTQQWDTKDLIQWALKQGYQDYAKIFKAEKVTGKILLNWDKKYIEDVLGILSVKVQQRMQVQLQQSNIQTEQNCTILAWGRNDRGQLGLNPSNNVSNPQKIVLPIGFSLLSCSNNSTMIYNPKSGVIRTNSVQQGKLHWISSFQKVSTIWSISSYKDLSICLCPVQKQSKSQQLSQTPILQKKQKLRTAKNIMDKIQWDENIDMKQFRVGHLDKYAGILEMTFEELLKSEEVKEYRIQYFKKSGQVVWSKKDRIDVL